MDYSSSDLSTSVSIIIDVGGILESTVLDHAQVADELTLIVLKLLIACQQSQSSYYWNYRFFDSRRSFSKTPVELNKYITLLRKNNYFSLNSFDFSYEVINSSSFTKWKEQLNHMFEVLSIGKKMHKSTKLMQSIEEQQQRIAHLKHEIELANESKDMKNQLTQQLQKESEYLNERYFLSSGSLSPDRTPFEVWLQTVEEAQHSLGVEAFSPTNVFFLGDLTNMSKSESALPSDLIDLSAIPEETSLLEEESMKQSLTIQVIDRRMPLQENALQVMTDQLTGKNAKFAKTIQWNMFSFSDVLLSSFSFLPFYPAVYPQKQPALTSSTFFTCKMNVMVNDSCVGEATCVDINQYTSNPVEVQNKVEEEENVTVMGDSYLIVVNGTRMLLSKEEYEKEQNAKKQERVRVEEVETVQELWIDTVSEMQELNLVQLCRNPYYLLCCSSMAFMQLMHSLVLHRQIITVVLQGQAWYGIPFTSTSLYLFAEDVDKTIAMTKQIDCDSLLRQNTNDLFFYWNTSNPSHTFPQDLMNTANVRKLANTKESHPEEEAFIEELRNKLQNASIEAIDSSTQKYLHIGDVGSIIKSMIDENYTAVLGMMNEEVDWFIKQIEELRVEFKKELDDTQFNEKIIGYLQMRLLSESEINGKYGVRLNSSVTHVRFREFILQVMIRLYIYKCTPDSSQQKASTDPIPSSVLKTIVHLLKQITYVFDLNDGTKTYLDRVFCPLFESSLPRSLAYIYDKLEIECPIKISTLPVKRVSKPLELQKEKKEIKMPPPIKKAPPRMSLIDLQKETKPLNRKTMQLNREKNKVDLLAMQLKRAAIASSIPAPSLDYKTIQHRVTKKR